MGRSPASEGMHPTVFCLIGPLMPEFAQKSTSVSPAFPTPFVDESHLSPSFCLSSNERSARLSRSGKWCLRLHYPLFIFTYNPSCTVRGAWQKSSSRQWHKNQNQHQNLASFKSKG
ncbi:hypothetical protein CDL15_Pgr000040 [Punica granatum]|uniref:Uncharacterized protein n=1 Tax=Punica granatum TaxID=22663 RepID=A0A218VPY5_PUNGR|nr:hypothetical protein CDL15_Pgr000040 [Punica granatum]